jgi:hypothetical protein
VVGARQAHLMTCTAPLLGTGEDVLSWTNPAQGAEASAAILRRITSLVASRGVAPTLAHLVNVGLVVCSSGRRSTPTVCRNSSTSSTAASRCAMSSPSWPVAPAARPCAHNAWSARCTRSPTGTLVSWRGQSCAASAALGDILRRRPLAPGRLRERHQGLITGHHLLAGIAAVPAPVLQHAMPPWSGRVSRWHTLPAAAAFCSFQGTVNRATA